MINPHEIAVGKPIERKSRILWANTYCLLDTSSGASLSIREMLRELAFHGYEIAIVGATVFDSPKGIVKIKEHWYDLQKKLGQVAIINDDPLSHFLFVTKSTYRDDMTSKEETLWHSLYSQILDTFKPDLIFYYGGQAIDYLVGVEAKHRGIPVAAYLVNGNFSGKRWCRDVDLIITDSRATAEFYLKKESYNITPVGTFIHKMRVVAPQHTRERLLFINPSLEKGAGIVIQLAQLLQERSSDIQFEVVESRGNWHKLVKEVTYSLGNPKETLSNVIVTQHTDDMRPIYSRARLLLAPSLCWESGARVLAEAMLNGIPAMITDHGGSLEMVQNAGICLKLPFECHEKPFTKLPKMETLEPLVDTLIRIYNDQSYYIDMVSKAYKIGQMLHSLSANTQRLIDAFEPLLRICAGDQQVSEY